MTVKSNDTGTIDKINAAVGDKVKKGDVLATIEGADNADKIDNEKCRSGEQDTRFGGYGAEIQNTD